MTGTKNLLEKFKIRRAELVAAAREINAELSEPLNPDFGEQAVELEDDEVLEGLGKTALNEIAQIDTAIQRIGNGIYDTCVSCGGPIGDARLDAAPYATRCMDCVEE